MWISDSGFYTNPTSHSKHLRAICAPARVWECQVVLAAMVNRHLLPLECPDTCSTSVPLSSRPEALPKHNEANKVNRGHLAFAWSDHLSNTWGFGVFSSKSHMAALNLERRQTDGTKGSLPKPHISVVLDNGVLKCWSLPYPFQPDILQEACLTL